MTDKVQKIREEVERIQLYTQSGVLKQILDYIDKVQEEPVNEKKCLFTKDNYTDEDRKVLCEDCDEDCEYAKKVEPVSEDLEEAYEKYTDERLKIIRPDIYDSSYSRSTKMTFDLFEGYELETAFEEGANWQKEQMMKDAVDGIVCSQRGDMAIVKSSILFPTNLMKGEKVKLIIVKED